MKISQANILRDNDAIAMISFRYGKNLKNLIGRLV